MAQGKHAQGTITLSVRRSNAGLLEVTIVDDGRGIDIEKLAKKAVAAGQWNPEQCRAASPEQKIDLIFMPNLSSRDAVTDTSGRGVGMDAVKQSLERCGGSIRVVLRRGRAHRPLLVT